MVVKPIRKAVRRWSNKLEKMWGLRENPRVVTRIGQFEYYQGNAETLRRGPQKKGEKRSQKIGEVGEVLSLGLVNKNVRDKKRTQVMYVNQVPHLWKGG